MFTDRLTVEYGDLTNYIAEDEIIANDFLNTYFYNRWKYDATGYDVPTSLELIISPKCNQACKYCYWVNQHNHIFPDKYYDEEKVKTNLLLILQWLDKNQFCPSLDIFSGELFAQEIGFNCLEIIYNYEKNVDPRWRIKQIMIPTNFSFVINEELISRVKKLQTAFEDIDINLLVSASFDGKYEEVNRPFSGDLDLPIGKPALDNDYYDKMFQAVSDLHAGLHPMVYSEHINDWKKNFLWFQDMMYKHDIPWDCLYLLEVRNDNWTVETIHYMQDFLEFLFDWVYNKCGKDKKALADFVIKQGFNILGEPIGRIPRGMPCGLQSEWYIRVSDLECYPCHRLGYDHLHYGHYEITNDENILKFIPTNVPLLLTIYGLHHRNLNYCAECPINHLCIGPCLGSNYESNHNFMTPAPTVCALKHAMCVTTIKMLIKYDIYYDIFNIVSQSQREQLEWLRKEINIDYD